MPEKTEDTEAVVTSSETDSDRPEAPPESSVVTFPVPTTATTSILPALPTQPWTQPTSAVIVPSHQPTSQEDYTYLPAAHLFLQDGTINPRYLPLFHTSYFMFKKLEAPWLANSLHIFGVAVDATAQYLVFIPALGCEQCVSGSALTLNPNDPHPRYPRTFLACVAGVQYVATRLQAAPANTYNPAAHRHKIRDQTEVMMKQHEYTGSSMKYVTLAPRSPDTFSIFGVPVYRSQSYFVYIPEFNNEYAVAGGNVSPNPGDSSTLLVTINRARYQATSLRPVFPELVYPATESTVQPDSTTTQQQQQPLMAFGIPILPKNTYYVNVPDMATEYIVFGENITLNDGNTVKIEVNGKQLVGIGVRPAFLDNNVSHGDQNMAVGQNTQTDTQEDTQTDTQEDVTGPRYKIVAFGLPINPALQYDVLVESLKETRSVKGSEIHLSPTNVRAVQIKSEADGSWLECSSIKQTDSSEEPRTTGLCYSLKGLIMAFGTPIS